MSRLFSERPPGGRIEFRVSTIRSCCNRPISILGAFVVGKYAGDRSFSGTSAVGAVVISFFIAIFNSFKDVAFLGHFHSIYNNADNIGDSSVNHHNFYSDPNFRTIPAILVSLDGSSFWIFCHFSFMILARLPYKIVTMELVLTSFAELGPPRIFGQNREFFIPNFILTFLSSSVGFGLTVVFLHLEAEEIYIPSYRRPDFYWYFGLIFYLSFFVFAVVLLPLAISKSVNRGGYSMFDLVRWQTSSVNDATRVIFTGICVVCTIFAGILTPFWLYCHVAEMDFPPMDEPDRNIHDVLFWGLLGVGIFVIVFVLVLQIVLYLVDGGNTDRLYRPLYRIVGRDWLLSNDTIRVVERGDDAKNPSDSFGINNNGVETSSL